MTGSRLSYLKGIACAGAMAVGLLGLSQAAQAAQASSPLNPSNVAKQVRPGNAHVGNSKDFNGNGIYVRHCYEAVWYDNGSGTYFVIAYNLEGDGESSSMPYAGSGNSSAQNTLLQICHNGGAYYIDIIGSAFVGIWTKAY